MTDLASEIAVDTFDPRGDWFDRWFEPSVYLVIAVNAIVTIWSLADSEHEAVFEPVHQGLMVFFAAEMLLRYIRTAPPRPKNFLSDKWNCFDLSLVVVGLLPMLGVGMVGLRMLRVARMARILHSARHASTLRIAHLFKGR